MKTNKRKPYQSESQLPQNYQTNSEAPPEVNGRVIFLGPTETMDALRGLAFMGAPVNRQEVKELAIEWVIRARSLNALKEPMILEIKREEIEALLKAPKCVSLKVLLAVETKANFNEPHQTFVLMPCDVNGRVILSNTGSPGAERWAILKNVSSVINGGGVVSGVERFLKEDLYI